jgi:hypothetical protein
MVPVTPVGTGLRPGDVISMLPSGIPVGEPAAMPSGDVALIVGVGVTVPSNCPSTCAIATLQTKSVGMAAAIKENLIGIFRFKATSPRRELIDDPECVFAISITAASRLEAPRQRTRMRRSAIVCRDLAAPMSISFATISPGARLSDIGQSLVMNFGFGDVV